MNHLDKGYVGSANPLVGVHQDLGLANSKTVSSSFEIVFLSAEVYNNSELRELGTKSNIDILKCLLKDMGVGL